GLLHRPRSGALGIVKRLPVLAVVLLLAIAGCGSDPQPPTTSDPTTPPASPSASPGASVTPSASPVELVQFTVDGAGPYKLGTTLDSLQAANQLAEVNTGSEVCPQNTYARGTGTWTDIRLAFRPDGALYMVTNRSPSIPTPSGAWLGTS